MMQRSFRVLSGIQPSGVPTIGNYLGALQNWVALQDVKNLPQPDETVADHSVPFSMLDVSEPDKTRQQRSPHEVLYMLADLHALTKRPEPEQLRQNILDCASSLLAIGVDPRRCYLFQQSSVPAHTELGWALLCESKIGWLSRMTQFKEKKKKHNDAGDSANGGLFAYPALMAADILIYKSTHVPVGDDQTQHLELTRQLARKMNSLMEDTPEDHFPVPTGLYPDDGKERIYSLNGNGKMSKSDTNDMTRINLTDEADLIQKKIQKAKSDSLGMIQWGETRKTRPEVFNLLTIYAGVAGIPFFEALRYFDGKGAAILKQELTEILVEKICPIGAEIKRIRGDQQYINQVLKQGSERANELAIENIELTKKVLGLKLT